LSYGVGEATGLDVVDDVGAVLERADREAKAATGLRLGHHRGEVLGDASDLFIGGRG